MTLTVGITDADIVQGKPGSPCWCPVALAIRRACPVRGVDIRVQRGRAKVRWFEARRALMLSVDLPVAWREWLQAYDRGVRQPIPAAASLAFKEYTLSPEQGTVDAPSATH